MELGNWLGELHGSGCLASCGVSSGLNRAGLRSLSRVSGAARRGSVEWKQQMRRRAKRWRYDPSRIRGPRFRMRLYHPRPGNPAVFSPTDGHGRPWTASVTQGPSSHKCAWASLGIRQSPRGDRLTVPTFGPSGRHERLNWLAKNRRRNTAASARTSLRPCTAGRRWPAPPGTGSSPAARRSGGSGTGRSRAARTGRSTPSVDCTISPSAPAGSSSGEISRRDDVEQRPRGPRRRTRSRPPSDQELHQRLGDADVGVVHAHVVGVVGAPAQRQLGQVAGADDEAGVHQQAGPHPRLHVLEDQVVPLLRRARARSCAVERLDVEPVERRCRTARGPAPASRPGTAGGCRSRGRDAEVPHQGPGVAPASRLVVPKPGMVRPRIRRAARRAGRTSCTATSSASVESSPPETPMATGGVPMCSSRLARPGDLDVEDLVAALAQLALARRHERVRIDRRGASGASAGVGEPHRRPAERAAAVRRQDRRRRSWSVRSRSAGGGRGRRRRRAACSSPPEPLATRRAACRSRRSGSGRRRRGRWSIPGPAGGVDVGGDAAARLAARPAAGGTRPCRSTSLLADRFSRTVAPARAWNELGGDRHPQVLADLDADDEARHARAARRAGRCRTGRLRRRQADGAAARGGRRGEPAGLVELLVIRQERLRHDAEHLPAVEDGGAVEELVVHDQRQADDRDAAKAGRCVGHAVPARSTAASWSGVVEQVGAGVAGQAQLGEDDDVDALSSAWCQQTEGAVGVEAESATRRCGMAAATRRKPWGVMRNAAGQRLPLHFTAVTALSRAAISLGRIASNRPCIRSLRRRLPAL